DQAERDGTFPKRASHVVLLQAVSLCGGGARQSLHMPYEAVRSINSPQPSQGMSGASAANLQIPALHSPRSNHRISNGQITIVEIPRLPKLANSADAGRAMASADRAFPCRQPLACDVGRPGRVFSAERATRPCLTRGKTLLLALARIEC